MLRSKVFLALAGSTLAIATAGAQARQPWSVQGSVLYTTQDLGPSAGGVGGVGVEAQIRRTLPRWSLGAGVQYSSHSQGGDDLSLTGVFVEPRLVLAVSSGRF